MLQHGVTLVFMDCCCHLVSPCTSQSNKWNVTLYCNFLDYIKLIFQPLFLSIIPGRLRWSTSAPLSGCVQLHGCLVSSPANYLYMWLKSIHVPSTQGRPRWANCKWTPGNNFCQIVQNVWHLCCYFFYRILMTMQITEIYY